MTIALKGNTQGGVIDANGVAAANVSSASGMPFMKNKLINGEVTRINQRNVANWAAVANGAYGYDRWKKLSATEMTQIIEAGNFRPNTVHTLSGIGVTTQQITSPASGNWQIPNIPIAATNVQVEEGLEATPFEVRPIGFELALCQRYFVSIPSTDSGFPAGRVGASKVGVLIALPQPLRSGTGLIGGGLGTVWWGRVVTFDNAGNVASVTNCSSLDTIILSNWQLTLQFTVGGWPADIRYCTWDSLGGSGFGVSAEL